MLKIPNIQKDIILAPYTTYNIGGPADWFVIVKNTPELISAIKEARLHNIPYFILGTGANILFGDKGFRGLIIKNESDNFYFEGNKLITESGATIEKLIKVSLNQELSGLEHFAGIPSSVGGALWQNLHFLSPDRSETLFIEKILEGATILNEDNEIISVDKDFFKFGYDKSILHNRSLVVLGATFILEPKSKEEILKQIKNNISWRKERQPQLDQYPSCGSVFKKIEGVGAGRLIEKVGLKGYQIGGIKSSEKHANFLVNTGSGTSSDVRKLISLIQEKVKKETGYSLETEISFVGEF